VAPQDLDVVAVVECAHVMFRDLSLSD
jgi:hypothetical protein